MAARLRMPPRAVPVPLADGPISPVPDPFTLDGDGLPAAALAASSPGVADAFLQTPPPIRDWEATGDLAVYSGYPADAQIAVSDTHVVVTARAVVAFYDKSGLLLQTSVSQHRGEGACCCILCNAT